MPQPHFTADTLLRALACVNPHCQCHRAEGRGYGLTHCPCHDQTKSDRTPSLSVSSNQGTVLWHCHNGCDQGVITEAIHQLFPLAERRVNGAVIPPAAGPAKVYDYGIARHLRQDNPDGTKRMWWEPTGTRMSALPLWNADLLDEHRKHRPDEPVLLVEGEKAADAAVRCGFTAVSFPGGAGQRDFGDAPKALAGLHVVQIPDLDDPGRSLMDAVATAVSKEAVEVRRGSVAPILDAKGADVADLLVLTGGDEIEARKLIHSIIAASEPVRPTAPEVSGNKRVTIYSAAQLAEMELPPVKEVVPGLYGVGHYLLSGAPKMGKSFLAMSLATAIGSGSYALGKVPVDKRSVLYLSLEDGLRRTVARLQHRLREMPEVPDISFAFSWPSLDEGGLDLIGGWMRQHQDGVVFIDTGKRLRQGMEEVGRSFYESDYDFIAPLTDLTHDADTLMLTLWHDRKMGADDFFDQVNSSRGLTAAVDGVSQLQRDRGSKEARLSIGDRDTEDRAFKLVWDELLLGWLLVEKVDVAQAKQSGVAQVLAAIRELQSSDMGVNADMLADKTGLPKGSVKNHLTTLRAQGVIEDTKRGWVRTVDEGE